jgi:hypothetical protein
MPNKPKSDDGFSVENLRIIQTPTIAKILREKKQRQKSHFVRLPLEWKHRLGGARRICTFKIAFELLYRHWKTGGRCVLLPTAGMVGVTRGNKWRGLSELERLGLIAIERRRRKSPKITLLFPADDDQ